MPTEANVSVASTEGSPPQCWVPAQRIPLPSLVYEATRAGLGQVDTE